MYMIGLRDYKTGSAVGGSKGISYFFPSVSSWKRTTDLNSSRFNSKISLSYVHFLQ